MTDTLTPEAVVTSVDATPLLQRAKAAGAYYGLRVRWRGTLLNFSDQSDLLKLDSTLGEKPVQVSVLALGRTTKYGFTHISGRMDAAEYRGIEALNEGDTVVITGVIAEVRAFMITLDSVAIEF